MSAGGSVRRPRGSLAILGWICVLSFLVNYGRVAFAPLVDYFIGQGTAPALAGLLATSVWLGSAAPRLPTGYLLTFLRRHVVLLGMGIWLCLAAAVMSGAPSILVAIGAAFGVGIATGAFFVAANPMLSELFPTRIGLVMGVRGMFSQIGAVVAPIVVGISIAVGTWRYSFVGLAVGALIATVGFWIAAKRTTLPDAELADRDLIGGIRAEWRLIAAGVLLVGLTGFLWQGVFNFYLTFLGADMGITRGRASQLLTLTFAAGIPSFIVFGRLADRLPFVQIMVAILFVFGVLLFVLTTMQTLLWIAIISVIMGFVIHGLFPVGDAYLLATLPDERRASAYSGYSATMMLAQAPGSVAVGVFAQLGVTYTVIFQVYAVVVVGLAILVGGLAIVGRFPTGR